MYSLILHDYIEHFKESFKNMKDVNLFIYIYFIFMPLISERSFSLSFFFHFTSFLPLGSSILLARMYGGKLSNSDIKRHQGGAMGLGNDTGTYDQGFHEILPFL